MRFAARAVVRGANAVVTNSPGTADLVSQLGATATVVPPGIDLSRFDPRPLPAQRRVLYLGGDFEHKGVDVARELADTLVGPGIRELDPSEIPGLMAAHSVVLVPSRAEPFGLVAAEAIASGRWVVARAVGGLIDIVTDGVNGSLVHDGDFAGALARVPDYDPATVASTANRPRSRSTAGAWRRSGAASCSVAGSAVSPRSSRSRRTRSRSWRRWRQVGGAQGAARAQGHGHPVGAVVSQREVEGRAGRAGGRGWVPGTRSRPWSGW